MSPLGRLCHGGHTLVELLVAMALGLFLMAAVVQSLISGKSTYVAINGLSEAVDSARLASLVIEKQLLRTGYTRRISLLEKYDDVVRQRLFAQDDFYGFTGGSVLSGQDNVRGSGNVMVGTDTLSLRYGGASDVPFQDCAGAWVDAGSLGEVVSIRFMVRSGGAAGGSLVCQSSAAAHQSRSIVDGVDAFQVLYGIDTRVDGAAGADRYISATEVEASALWDHVVTVRYALLVRSTSGGRQLMGGATHYRLLDAPSLTFDDGLARRVISQTVSLRNRLN